MRKFALAISGSLVFITQGCTLTLPAGLLAGGFLKVPAATSTGTLIDGNDPGASTASTAPGGPRTRPSGMIGRLPPAPLPFPSVGPFDPGCPAIAADTLKHFDRDHDGAWNFEEFQSWYKGVQKPDDCVTAANDGMGVTANNGGALILDKSGGLIARNAGGVLENNGGGFKASNGSGTVVSANGNFSASNKAGALITNDAGQMQGMPNARVDLSGPLALVSDGGPTRQVPMRPCFPDAKTAFTRTDTNQDGRITIEELCRNPYFPPIVPPEHPQPSPPPNNCKASFLAADANMDGGVDFNEFLGARLPHFIQPPVGFIDAPAAVVGNAMAAGGATNVNFILTSSLRLQFDKLDSNGDGIIDAGEWCSLPAPPTPGPGRSMPPFPFPTPQMSVAPSFGPIPANCDFTKIDANGDGQISGDEFIAWSQINTVPAPSINVILQTFQNLDRDHNAMLSSAEWCQGGGLVPTPVASQNIPPGSCGLLFDSVDANHDGFVSFDEYATAKWKRLQMMNSLPVMDQQAAMIIMSKEAASYDADGDQKLSVTEFFRSCANANTSTSATPSPTPTPTPFSQFFP